MRCHQCNQDTIKIHESNGSLHIKCDICGLDIDIGLISDSEGIDLFITNIVDLFIYNENLESAEKLGSDNYIDGKELGDNPYLLSGDQLMLNRSWERGYISERESYENVALIISSERMEKELSREVERLELDKEYYKDQLILSRKLKDSIFICIDEFCCKLLDRKILSIFYRKDVKKFMGNLNKNYYKENPDS